MGCCGAGYCFVACEVSLEADGWLLEAELDWEAEADGWFEEAEADGWFDEAEADWPEDAELDGWFAEADVDGWFDEADAEGWLLEAEALVSLLRPGMSAFACLAWSMAAWVFGPMTPSTGPGSKPLSFRACCSLRTDSSPEFAAADFFSYDGIEDEADWFADAEAAGWFAEADCEVEAEAEGWFAEAEVEADAAGWFAEAVAAGWFAEDADWLADDLSLFAMTGSAAITAAARASFLKSMVVFLSSYTKREDTVNCRAVPFGACNVRKFPRRSAPSDARCLRAVNRGSAT